MIKKEQKLLLELRQLRDVWEVEAWQQDNDASLFSDSFINEVNDLREALETEALAMRDMAMDYYRQEDRISDDPEIR